MSSKSSVRELSEHRVIGAFYSGGRISIDDQNRLYTPFQDRVFVTDVTSGRQICTLGTEPTSSDSAVTCICTAHVNLQNKVLACVAYANSIIAAFEVGTDGGTSETTTGQENDQNEEKDVKSAVSNEKCVATLKRRWKSTHKSPIVAMTLSKNGALLATGSTDFIIKVWHMTLNYCVHTFGPMSDAVSILKFHSDKAILYSADCSGQLAVYSLMDTDKENRRIELLESHSSAITALDLCQIGDKGENGESDETASFWLTSASRDRTCTIWTVSKNGRVYNKVRTVPVFECLECIVGVMFAPDIGMKVDLKAGKATLYLTVGESGILKMWDFSKGRCLYERRLLTEGHAASLTQILPLRSVGQYCISTSEQNLLFVDAFSLAVQKHLAGHNDEILDVCFLKIPSSNGNSNSDQSTTKTINKKSLYLAAATNSAELRFYSVDTLDCQLLAGHTDSVLCVQSARGNEQIFASGSKDSTAILWHVLPGANDFDRPIVQKFAVASGHTGAVSALKLANGNVPKFLLTTSYDLTVKLWPLDDVTKGISDRKRKSAAEKSSDETVAVRLQAACTSVAHTKEITCIDVAPNNQVIATGSLDKTIKFWRIDDNLQLIPSGTISGPHKRGIWHLQFSPTEQVHFTHDGAQVLSSDGGGQIKVWNIRDGDCAYTLQAHEGKVWALACAKGENPQLWASGGADARLVLWLDVTESKEKSENELWVKRARNDQAVKNLMDDEKYSEALSLSLNLDRTRATLDAVSALIRLKNAETGPENCAIYPLSNAIESLSEDEKLALVKLACVWNTNGRLAMTAQTVLNCLILNLGHEKLLKSHEIHDSLLGAVGYTQRHFDRLTKLKQSAALLNFTWSNMKIAQE